MGVVGGRDVESPGGHQREAAAHAEPDHAGAARAVGVLPQPRAHDLDVVEGRALAAQHRAERRADAAHGAAGAVEVGGDREIAGRRQPVGLAADVVDQTERLVEHDDAGPGPVADGRHGKVGVELGRGRAARDRDGGDGGLLFPVRRGPHDCGCPRPVPFSSRPRTPSTQVDARRAPSPYTAGPGRRAQAADLVARVAAPDRGVALGGVAVASARPRRARAPDRRGDARRLRDRGGPLRGRVAPVAPGRAAVDARHHRRHLAGRRGVRRARQRLRALLPVGDAVRVLVLQPAPGAGAGRGRRRGLCARAHGPADADALDRGLHPLGDDDRDAPGRRQPRAHAHRAAPRARAAPAARDGAIGAGERRDRLRQDRARCQ